MNKSTRVALQGFSRAERSTFESFFALAGQRTPSYAQEADPTRAHFILVDADDATACELLIARGLMGRAVALGAQLQAEALLQLPRPINLMLVVRALDALPRTAARPRTPSGADPDAMVDATDTQPSDAIDRVLQELAYRTVALPGGVDYRAAAARAGQHAAAKPAEPARPPSLRPAATARPPTRPLGAAALSGSLAPAALSPPGSGLGPRTIAQPSAYAGAPANVHSSPPQRVPTGHTTARPAPASTRAQERAEANLAPSLERPPQRSAGAPNSPFANTEAPTITSVDIPVWADARAITAGLAAQAAAEAWPTLVAPPETSAALWLPDLQESPAAAHVRAPAPAPASASASASASTSISASPHAAGPSRVPTPVATAARPLTPVWSQRSAPAPAAAAPASAQAPTAVRTHEPVAATARWAVPIPIPTPTLTPTPAPMAARDPAPLQAVVALSPAPSAAGPMDSNPFPTLPPLEPPDEPDVTPDPEPPTAAHTEPAAAFGATAPAAQAQTTAAPNAARTEPEVEPSTSVKQAPATAPNPSVPREAPGAAHVLVVDDGDLALRFISNQLKRYGFQVHVAREPREALAQLQARRYEFVFIEINLETDSNFPVTQAIRQAPLGPGEKAAAVVLLADRHSNSELQAAANAGADAWLTTPLLEADLSKLVGPRLAPRAKTADNELRSAAYP